jgi:hypothetical protein
MNATFALRELAAVPAGPACRVLSVEFRSIAGRRWTATGGGATVRQAIASARQALPAGTWVPVGWSDLYGE